MVKKFDRIVMHRRPHLDELVALWLLLNFGEEKFPGISKVKVAFSDDGGESPHGLSAEDWEQEGVLLLGIGGGPFDDHPASGKKRKQGECTTTLVAKKLGLDDEPAFEKILKFTQRTDLKGSHPFDLANLVETLHRQYPADPRKVMGWTIMVLDAKYQEQLGFLTTTKKEFDEKATVEEIQGPGKRIFKLVTVVSDNEQINAFARSRQGVKASIVIQQRSSGNVQIFTNQKEGLILYDVVQMIRLAEQKKKGNVITTDWKTLALEGRVDGAEEWWFHEKAQQLLNGSLTAKKVPPTKLSLEEIKEIVRIGVNPGAFESECASCSQGKCLAFSKDNPCSWYAWGLHRCRKIRHKMSQE